MTEFQKIMLGLMRIRSYGADCTIEHNYDEIAIYPPEGVEVSESDKEKLFADLDWEWDEEFYGWRFHR